VRRRTFDAQHALANVGPAERKRLTRPQPGVGQNRNKRRIPRRGCIEKYPAKQFDLCWRDRSHATSSTYSWLPDFSHWVSLDPAPRHRRPKDPLQDCQGFSDRRFADAGSGEFNSQLFNALSTHIAKTQNTDSGEQVTIPDNRVAIARVSSQIRDCVDHPPLLDELAQKLGSPIDLWLVPKLARTRDPDTESVGISLSRERLRSVPPALPPADFELSSIGPTLHAARSILLSAERDPAALALDGGGPVTSSDTTTNLSCSQRSTSQR
jgi:hypothetical protein